MFPLQEGDDARDSGEKSEGLSFSLCCKGHEEAIGQGHGEVCCTHEVTSVPQYQELQTSARLHGDSMQETKIQISQLQQAIKKLQSQIENLKMQVRVLEPMEYSVSHWLCTRVHPGFV